MQIKMKMPDLATSASVVTILKWLVEVGQPIKRGQPLVEIETDKAAMEVESFANGILVSGHAQPNEEVAVGTVIATIDVADPATASSSPEKPASATAKPEPAKPSSIDKLKKQPTVRPAGGLFARNRAAGANPESEEK